MAARPIVILGMHRSGTSCLAGSLQQRGLFLGEVYESRPYNRKGNRESQRIMDLNDAVLGSSGGAWDRPPPQVSWTADAAAERDAIIAALEAGAGGAAWGFKDPRTLLTLPFWRERLPGARLAGTFRHPARVARSLLARDPSMPLGTALDLWLAYNERLLAVHAADPLPLLDFDAAPGAYGAALDALACALGLAEAAPGHVPFFEDALRTSGKDAEEPVVEGRYLAVHARLVEAAGRSAS